MATLAGINETQSLAYDTEQAQPEVSTTGKKKPSRDSFQLSHHAADRALKIKPPERKKRQRKRANPGFGIVFLNILTAVASYATDASMECWPAVPTIAADTGYAERLVSYALAQFEKAGIFNRKERYEQSTKYLWIRSDRKPGYTVVNRKWWNENADLGEGRGLFVAIHAALDGKSVVIDTKLDSVRLFGVSRSKLYRLLPLLKAKGMVVTQSLKHGTLVKVVVSQWVANESKNPARHIKESRPSTSKVLLHKSK